MKSPTLWPLGFLLRMLRNPSSNMRIMRCRMRLIRLSGEQRAMNDAIHLINQEILGEYPGSLFSDKPG